MSIWFVFLGGAFGGSLREALLATGWHFVSSQLWLCAINTVGCLLLGLMRHVTTSKASSRLSDDWQRGLTVGFCGGFTTFSSVVAGGRSAPMTHPLETVLLLVGQVGVSLCAYHLGCLLQRRLRKTHFDPGENGGDDADPDGEPHGGNLNHS